MDFARRKDIVIVNDNTYSFILNEHPISILSIPGAKECCIEFRFRYACGRCGIGRSCEDSLGELRFAGESGLVGCVNVLPRLADACLLYTSRCV